MNKKGQTLVIFILFLPIIAFLIIMIINKSNMYYDKRNIENVIKEAINYGLNNIEDENIENKMQIFIGKNIECEKEIIIKDKTIKVTLKKTSKELKKILGYKDIKITYKGYIENEKIKIVKE